MGYVDQETARLTSERLDELAHVRTALPGVPVERVMRFGEPDEGIVLEAEVFADLIALTASRRGRLETFVLPDIAERGASKTDVSKVVLRG
jgi:nucleotide-binding universal stress UspA family protein